MNILHSNSLNESGINSRRKASVLFHKIVVNWSNEKRYPVTNEQANKTVLLVGEKEFFAEIFRLLYNHITYILA